MGFQSKLLRVKPKWNGFCVIAKLKKHLFLALNKQLKINPKL